MSVAAFGDNQPTERETPAVFFASPMLALAGAVIGFFVASLASPRLRAATWENPSRRFNWIVLLVGAIVTTGIGVAGVLADDAYEAVPWFVIGICLAGGSVILRLMRLP
ncbi:hypothetical protein M2152_001601 [Microbacteriaceae bacterium SG_E_30_P1]|uniref:Uncharacterized protein n=1 Tax=Antiquaquibacter oligotrophicus TaxID=2880260 RepID=A0ABT6KQE4_9MICO|nr:hypothetical protein [Antiquaquibacter oligotrophicus]MDH6181419.1 hypothetical protein [Antiquaquibacter oligotrophicus]UDF12889.1 hypothetical protein LH407_12110 [Antiquaquibacter oligotrophicus]